MEGPFSLYIDGEWVVPEGGTFEPVINPATGATIGSAAVGGRAETEGAIAAAQEAFAKGPWPRLSAVERQRHLERFHAALMSRRTRIRSLITAEAGATQGTLGAQFDLPMKLALHTIAICARDPVTPLSPEIVNVGEKSWLSSGVSIREPAGVVSAITAYNFPFFLNVAKVVPALAAGCTIVLKPSPYTPLQALILGEAADEAGIPRGVLNIVTGGVEVGEQMTTDPRVAIVSFTGSDIVGSAIQAQAAPTLKRVLLELGGKSALIVRSDADIAAAAFVGMIGFTMHCGQGCALLTRHIVQNSIRKQYVDMVRSLAERLKIGDPADPGVTMGPLIREAQRGRVESFVASAHDQGARLITGGRRPAGLDNGFFFEPTLFDDVDNASRLGQEEVFGPIGAVMGFDTDEQAIALANDSAFGLSGGIFTADTALAYEMAMQIRTGEVAINGGAGTMLSSAPFGGIKRSGYGREYGLEGLNEFTYLKTVSFHAA